VLFLVPAPGDISPESTFIYHHNNFFYEKTSICSFIYGLLTGLLKRQTCMTKYLALHVTHFGFSATNCGYEVADLPGPPGRKNLVESRGVNSILSMKYWPVFSFPKEVCAAGTPDRCVHFSFIIFPVSGRHIPIVSGI
jgi:hypothetical protein